MLIIPKSSKNERPAFNTVEAVMILRKIIKQEHNGLAQCLGLIRANLPSTFNALQFADFLEKCKEEGLLS